MITSKLSQVDFYKEFLMSRHKFELTDFGIDMGREQFDDLMADSFNDTYRGQWTIDEMLLHPREAIRFCDDVRRANSFFDIPDDIILRVIMQRRKNPAG